MKRGNLVAGAVCAGLVRAAGAAGAWTEVPLQRGGDEVTVARPAEAARPGAGSERAAGEQLAAARRVLGQPRAAAAFSASGTPG